MTMVSTLFGTIGHNFTAMCRRWTGATTKKGVMACDQLLLHGKRVERLAAHDSMLATRSARVSSAGTLDKRVLGLPVHHGVTALNHQQRTVLVWLQTLPAAKRAPLIASLESNMKASFLSDGGAMADALKVLMKTQRGCPVGKLSAADAHGLSEFLLKNAIRDQAAVQVGGAAALDTLTGEARASVMRMAQAGDEWGLATFFAVFAGPVTDAAAAIPRRFRPSGYGGQASHMNRATILREHARNVLDQTPGYQNFLKEYLDRITPELAFGVDGFADRLAAFVKFYRP